MKHLFSEYIDLRPKEWDIVFRVHATKRMFSRLIDSDDVLHLFSTGMVIEEYQDDFPFPEVDPIDWTA